MSGRPRDSAQTSAVAHPARTVPTRQRTAFGLGVLWAVAAVAGCALARNYTAQLGPRYAGDLARVRAHSSAPPPERIRVVTFNLKFGEHVDRAIELFESDPALRGADIVALQEMDARGTSRLADALGMAYVYYPATVHPKTGRDFGNAVLSRWPIAEDRKILLPHPGGLQGTRRAAVAATVVIGDVRARVYSVHLGTEFEIGPEARRDQMREVLADAARYERVVVAGDMNSHAIGEELRAHGYRWPTERQPATSLVFNWDHIFVSGFAPAGTASTGVVRDSRGASDHRPVWTVVVVDSTDARARGLEGPAGVPTAARVVPERPLSH